MVGGYLNPISWNTPIYLDQFLFDKSLRNPQTGSPHQMESRGSTANRVIVERSSSPRVEKEIYTADVAYLDT